MSKEYRNRDEITFKELIIKLVDFKNEILKKWLWILLVTLPLMGYMYYKAANAIIQYEAELTFMVSEDEHGGMSSMAGLLGQFGFGGIGGGKSNPEKMLELLMTRKITERALLQKVIMNGKEDYLANHFIESLETDKNWAYQSWFEILRIEPSRLLGFRFSSSDLAKFSRLENSALKKLHGFISGSNKKLDVSISERSGIMKIVIQTSEEELSIQILEKLFDELSKYYYAKTVEKTEKNYKLIKNKVDSLFSLLSSQEFQLAQFLDSNKGLINRTGRLRQDRLQRDIGKHNIMYGEASKNLEIAEFSFNLRKPYINVVDMPIIPLKKVIKPKFKNGFLGFVFGIFICALFIVLRKVFKDALD